MDLQPPDPFPWKPNDKIYSFLSKDIEGIKEEINRLREDFKEEVRALKTEIKDVRKDISSLDDCWTRTAERIEEDVDKDIFDSVNEHNCMKNRISDLEKSFLLMKKIIYTIGGLVSSMFLLIFAEWVGTWF